MQGIRAVFFGAFAAALAAAAPAAADFGDCAEQSYLDDFFDTRLSVDPFGCTELYRGEFTTASGTRELRVVQGFNADWAAAPGYADQVIEGARASVAALNRLSGFQSDDITIYLVDDLPPRRTDGSGDFSNILGAADAIRPDECLIGLYLLTTGGTDFVAHTVAHELFHCIQYETAGSERVLTLTRVGNPGGDWWVEGGAEWFAAFAVPGYSEINAWVSEFDAVADERPIHDMAYEALVFFYWYVEHRDPNAVIAMMDAMAISADAGAQQAAMRSILSAEEWLEFAEAYFDSQIVDVNGAALALSPVEGEVTAWTEEDTHTLNVRPFVIERGRLTFECGRWRTEIRAGERLFETRELEARDWRALPSEINAENHNEAQQYWVGLSTDESETEIRIHAEITAACAPCAGTEEIDSCLVGSWQMSGGGAAEWMRGRLPPNVSMPSFNDSEGVVTYRADGSYFTAPYSYTMTLIAREGDGVTTAEGGGAAISAGRWSAVGGSLNQCPDAESLTGSVTVTSPHGTGTMPLNRPPGAGAVTWRYSCADTSLSTTMEFPGMGPMVTEFTRLTPPPDED